MKSLFPLFLYLLSLWPALGQKVGVVLSGGGAKGLAHIGVIKALEKSEIPIDYIAGTSMGGIIAGTYAGGLSPKQLEDIALSPSFFQWVHGNTIRRESFDYGTRKDDPAFIRWYFTLAPRTKLFFNRGIAKDWAINFALAELMARPSSVCRANFDSLFVPLRILGADIFTQRQIVLDSGVLSTALRITQTVPFFYRPIKIGGKYLFDGGLYNNFPVDVMQQEFKPDVIIGSNVTSEVYEAYPYQEDQKILSESLLSLILNKADPSQLSGKDVYIRPDLKDYSVFSFEMAKQLIDSGYVQTMRQMESIKSKITARRTDTAVAEQRLAFLNRAPPVLFHQILFEGFTPGQQRYISKFFRKKGTLLSLRQIKKGYYRLMSEDYFSTIYPDILFDSTTRYFHFKLTRSIKNNFAVDAGGVVATRNVSAVFLGINHFLFKDVFIHSNVRFYGSIFHKSAEARLRIYIPLLNQVYFQPSWLYNTWSYSKQKGLLPSRLQPDLLNKRDYKVGIAFGALVGRQYQASLYSYYLEDQSQYFNSEVFTSTDTLDNLALEGVRTGISLSTNTLNSKQYASRGKAFYFSFDWFRMRENYIPGSTSEEPESRRENRFWVKGRATMEQYFTVNHFYHTGYYFDAVVSNQDVLTNYQGSLVSAPAFYPMQDSKTLFLRNFRSFSYLAGGWRNIFTLYKNLDLRLSAYIFLPMRSIIRTTRQKAVLEDSPFRLFLAANANMVYHTPLGPLSVSVNYYQDTYNDTDNKLGFLLHFGFLLFNKSAMD